MSFDLKKIKKKFSFFFSVEFLSIFISMLNIIHLFFSFSSKGNVFFYLMLVDFLFFLPIKGYSSILANEILKSKN
jgi:hypothetical protein